jgi:hypothetical protein
MIIVTATTSITSATVTPTNHGWDRRMIKPVSAAISNAAAINSAIRPNPCDVIIALTAQSNRVTPVEEEARPSGRGGLYFNHRMRVVDAVIHAHLNDRKTLLDGARRR